MHKVLALTLLVVGMLPFLVAVSAVYSVPVYLLWGYVAPALGVQTIDFWHAWALTLLCSLLFKSSGSQG
jgi:hypothetical protein